MILTIKTTTTKAFIGTLATAFLAGTLAAQTTGAAAQLRAQASALGVEIPPAMTAPLAEPVAGSHAETLAAGPAVRKMSGTCSYEGRTVSYTVRRWETGRITTKDENGNEVLRSFEYPVLAPLTDVRTMGDFDPCWNVCHDVCDGYGVCMAVCTYKCATQGGTGDPRRP